MEFWKLYWIGLLPVSALYILSLARFYRRGFSFTKDQALGWESRFQSMLLAPFVEGLFYLLFSSAVVYLTIRGRQRDIAESMQLLFLSPILFLGKAVYAVKGWSLLSSMRKSPEGLEDTGFIVSAKRQLSIIVLFSSVITVPIVATFSPFASGKEGTRGDNAVRTTIGLYRSALASYSGGFEGKYPVGCFDYYQFRNLFPGSGLPEETQDAGFTGAGFMYDSEDGTTYIIWLDVPAVIKVTPAKVVPNRYDPG